LNSKLQGLAGVGNLQHACHTWHAKTYFQWHAGAPSLTYHFCYDSHRRYIDLDFHKYVCCWPTEYFETL